jgi:molybdenum cofactor guanylyltransferase
VIGAVLAGGAGRRLGGAKATVELGGRTLLAYAIEALQAALAEGARVAVVAKPTTALPALPAGVERWEEPEEPQHPACGLREALRRGGGEEVLVVPVDLPLMTGQELRAVAKAAEAFGVAPGVVASVGGRMQPLVGVWRPGALPGLEAAGEGEALVRIALELGVRTVERPARSESYLNVNTAGDLSRAEMLVRSRG